LLISHDSVATCLLCGDSTVPVVPVVYFNNIVSGKVVKKLGGGEMLQFFILQISARRDYACS